MNFTEEVRALFGQYKENMKVLRDESTLELFTYILKNPNKQVRPTSLLKVQIGKFYIIKYNYNGNKLWCPILTIPPIVNTNESGVLGRQLKTTINNKNILYAINFDYLPIVYKTLLVESIIKNNKDRYELNSNKISNGGDVKDEFNFKVDWIYNFLNVNGKKQYAITAFDITKIKNVFEISSTILHRFVFLDTYYINNRLMYDTLSTVQNEKLRGEFSDKIKTYEGILKIYETDVEQFYKSLRSFEKNLKLIDNL
jgi:hypothetical protein